MQHIRSDRFAFELVATLGLASTALAGGVRIVDSAGSAPYPDVQAAVDAAVTGDVIVVGAGNYTGFVVDGKGLFIVARPGPIAAIHGAIEIKNLSGANVILSGLTITGPSTSAAVRIHDCAGNVRIQQCAITGTDAQPAVLANSADQLALVQSTLTGGVGDDALGFPPTPGQAGPGGHGLDASFCRIVLDTTSSTGGAGGFGDDAHGGKGGEGAHLQSCIFFAAGGTLKGGAGGHSYDYSNILTHGGNGGVGLNVGAGTGAELLGCATAGGAGGCELHFGGCLPPSPPTLVIGSLTQLAGTPRRLSGPALLDDETPVPLAFTGLTADRLHVAQSNSFAFVAAPALLGWWFVPTPLFLGQRPDAVLATGGTVNVPFKLPRLPATSVAGRRYLQGIAVTSSGQSQLSSPLHVALLNRDVGPDCNGNGRNDFVDLLDIAAFDCDGDMLIDACQPGYVDCNSNGRLDSCDIASGTSPDVNGDGIPDECQVGTTWWVDANAPAGGNGSAANPFNAIAPALQVSVNGDRVLIKDGVYVGAQNRNLNFGGRSIVVRSQNGPTNCILDCQGQGYGFRFDHNEGPGARLEALTIENGVAPWRGGGIYTIDASPIIDGCVVQNCSANVGGGGVAFENGAPALRNCVIRGNTCPGDAATGRYGGGVYVVGGARLIGCLIENNSTKSLGGGVYLASLAGSPPAAIVRCTIRSNRCQTDVPAFPGTGGGIFADCVPVAGSIALIEECLVVGNLSERGGGVAISAGDVRITDTTISGNTAAQFGGGIALHLGGANATATNLIVWGNSSPVGAQFSVAKLGLPISTIAVRYSDVQGGLAAFGYELAGSSAQVSYGPGNIDLDPRFVDPDGPDNNPATWADNNLHLRLNSVCVDSADNSGVFADVFDLDGDGNVSEPTPFDLDAAARFVEIPSAPNTGAGVAPLVDMGCYERQP